MHAFGPSNPQSALPTPGTRHRAKLGSTPPESLTRSPAVSTQRAALARSHRPMGRYGNGSARCLTVRSKPGIPGTSRSLPVISARSTVPTRPGPRLTMPWCKPVTPAPAPHRRDTDPAPADGERGGPTVARARLSHAHSRAYRLSSRANLWLLNLAYELRRIRRTRSPTVRDRDGRRLTHDVTPPHERCRHAHGSLPQRLTLAITGRFLR